ncbi:MAG: hydrolase, partial [Fluviibacter sp.]
MKLDADRSVLLIVDLQERLLPVIEHGHSILEHAAWLIGVARQLGVPVLLTEQYPQGLGTTAPAI